jgi:predicted DsbA family dithiol-disulfide isomerase
MNVDIVIDTICPWCYIGKRRFDRALSLRPQPRIEVSWRPFQLNPNMPRAGMDRETYIARKFGGQDRARRIYTSVIDAGTQEGIDFRFDLIKRTPNTIDSHRLIAAAAPQGRQTAAVDAVFRAYFSEGRDIGDLDVLANIADGLGLDRTETRRSLAGSEGREEVLAFDDMARGLGVNGVPCYIVDRRYAISGAQSPEVFLQVFDLARQDLAEVAAE